jgi:bifunctional ADP-heptose synthase (sugar kinase/adenylyltransferase)
MSLIKVNTKKLAKVETEHRIFELKKLLEETDYIVLSDYDKDKTEIKSQRHAWREEIRDLENLLKS